MALSDEVILKVSETDVVGRFWPTLGDHSAKEFLSEIECRLRYFPAGSAVAYEGQNLSWVAFVLEGWLGLSKSLEDGQTQIVDFALPGDIALPANADGLTSQYNITAHTPVRLAIFSNADWERIAKEIPGLWNLARLLEAGVYARLSERFLRMGKGNASMRIAYALLEFFVRLNPSGQKGTERFHIPLKQQQFGDFAGLSSVHVCRTLKRLSSDGILTVEDHMDITINDIAALAKIAEVSMPRLRASIAPQWLQGRVSGQVGHGRGN